MEFTKVCKNCGKTFSTDNRHKICCCYKCRSSYEKMMKRLNSQSLETAASPVEGKAVKKLLSPSQVADYLCVSKKTVYNYIASGVIACIELPGRKMISRDQLDSLFKNSTQKVPIAINFNDYITFYQMCDEYHFSYNYVRNVCKEQGLKPIIRSSIKYYKRDLVAEAFLKHGEIVAAAKAERQKEYARRKEVRKSKEYINVNEVEHSMDEYSFAEIMKIYHLDRNQVWTFAHNNEVHTRHVGRFVLFNKKEFDEIFSVTPPFDF